MKNIYYQVAIYNNLKLYILHIFNIHISYRNKVWRKVLLTNFKPLLKQWLKKVSISVVATTPTDHTISCLHSPVCNVNVYFYENYINFIVIHCFYLNLKINLFNLYIAPSTFKPMYQVSGKKILTTFF